MLHMYTPTVIVVYNLLEENLLETLEKFPLQNLYYVLEHIFLLYIIYLKYQMNLANSRYISTYKKVNCLCLFWQQFCC